MYFQVNLLCRDKSIPLGLHDMSGTLRLHPNCATMYLEYVRR